MKFGITLINDKKKINNIHTVLLTGANGGLGSELADKVSEHCTKLILLGRNKNSLLKLKSYFLLDFRKNSKNVKKRYILIFKSVIRNI